jgi:uncharacterized protein (TIGR03435 family)
MNTPVRNLILRAYPLDPPIEVRGLPGWADVEGERYNVIAKGKAGASAEELQQMWRALLEERMKLAAHYEAKEQGGYNLVRSRPDGALGAGLKPSTLDCSQPAARPQPGMNVAALGTTYCGFSLTDLDGTMRTGGMTMAAFSSRLAKDLGRPGLKLESSDVTGRILVVDHIERPSED